VIQVLSEFSSCVERASIDEAYIDLSSAVEEKLNAISESQDMFSTLESKDYVKSLKMEHFGTNFVMGYEDTKGWLDMIEGSEMCPMDDVKLTIGAQIVGEMREAVYQKTGFRCSAGIAHNKVCFWLKQRLNHHEYV
jgi:DNA polymerase eta